jgi:hypothetical protein
MAFDPVSGELWEQENGDDTFDEINRVERGMNGGWVQVAGPIERVAQFRAMETTFGGRSLQQLRWPPTNIAETPEEARARIQALDADGALLRPRVRWKWAVPPGGIGFVDGNGPRRRSSPATCSWAAPPRAPVGGHLFRFKLDSTARLRVRRPAARRPRGRQHRQGDITESESLLVGPQLRDHHRHRDRARRHLYAVSTNRGAIYEITPAG